MNVMGFDPRFPVDRGPRPIVAKRSTGMPTWMLVAFILLAGLLLFLILDGRRLASSAPTTRARVVDNDGAPPPIAPLFVPPEPVLVEPAPSVPPVPRPTATPIAVPIKYAPPVDLPRVSPGEPPPVPSARPRNGAGGSVLVFDNTAGDTTTATETRTASPGTTNSNGSDATRARATIFRNRATTVGQGTLIPAVLESALDSTRPGPARALVTRDVRGFDGSKVLIPRGSRLIGEYRADLQPGQSRALVIWTRLVRPDGATIALGSPSADTLGRIGIKGQVNSHFLERFGSALLQTAMSIGTGAATRSLSGNSIAVLAVPGATGSVASTPLTDGSIQRTLRVRQGVSISVFVARDLDFTAVESGK
jgi:type IV secretion system protein VirB10